MIFKELYIHRSRMIKFAIVSIAFATRLLSYLLKLRTNGPNNSQHSQHCCLAKNVGIIASVLAQVCNNFQ